MKTLKIGDTIPSFILKDQNGHEFNSDDYAGKKKLVIYFYPKDESSVCTAEACGFRDNFPHFNVNGAVVVGINNGTVESHFKFAQKNRIPFQLLSDPGNRVLRRFGVKPWLFLTGRETFVIGTDGKIAYTHRAFLDGGAHSQKVIEFLNR